jgi:integrase
MVQSTSAHRGDKPERPEKPYPEFSLFPHATRRWAKKIRGKMHYFGPWDDPTGALNRYLDQKDDLHAGRKPRAADDDRLTVRDLCNRYLTSKKHQVDTRELSPRTFADYHATCELVIEAFGCNRVVNDLRRADFEALKMRLPASWGLSRRSKTIQMVRCLFRYAVDEDLVDKAIKFGNQFKLPSKQAKRLHMARAVKRMFEAAELRSILNAAGVQLRAMILLGVNLGYGNNDVATLPLSALDLERGWATHARPKTGIDRRGPLWQETVEALRAALAKRPAPKNPEHGQLVFVTKYGLPWVKVACEQQEDGTLKVKCDDAISKEMAKVLKALGLARRGANFYALRHVFETIGGESRDQVAVDHIMGHADPSMADHYRERISDERLLAVTAHVYRWLLGSPKAAPSNSSATPAENRVE